MALQSGEAHYCKVTHFENQKAVTRRVTCIEVHRTDGRVVRLRGADLPDSICIQTGPESDSDGKGFLQVIELPERAFASAWLKRFFTARDGFSFMVGMLAATIVFMWVFSFWVELHDVRLKTTPPAMYQPYRPRY